MSEKYYTHNDLIDLVSSEKCKWFSIGYLIAKGGAELNLTQQEIMETDKEAMRLFIELYNTIMENWGEP